MLEGFQSIGALEEVDIINFITPCWSTRGLPCFLDDGKLLTKKNNPWCILLSSKARWFLWNVSAHSHMTSVTKRNMLDPTGKVGDCSYTPHNHHPLGWIFLQGENMSFFSFLIFFRKHCLHNVLNLHQLPNGTYRCYNCVPHILPTPCTSLTYVAEKVPS